MNGYDVVAVERALKGDRSVALYDDEKHEILRRYLAGQVPPEMTATPICKLLRMSGATFNAACDRVRGTTDRRSA